MERDAQAARGDSTGEAAAARVKGILDAAEATAAQIVSDAKAQADSRRQEAERTAERIHGEVLAAAEEHLATVEQATARLRSRVRAAVEGDLEQAPSRGEETELSADLDGARLIALNMALNGDSREQTDRYLAENFDLPERTKLVEEVYAAVEG